jgi:hypothetical protein
MHDITGAIGQVLFQMSQMNHTMTLNYVDMSDAELSIQEGYTRNWVQTLVSRCEDSRSLALFLGMYEDSLDEFQAKRTFIRFVGRGDEPPGIDVWKKVKGTRFLLDPKDDTEGDAKDIEEDDGETTTLDSLEEADQLFKDESLSDAAKKLRISTSDAADLKFSLPLLLERKAEKSREEGSYLL